MDFEALLAEAEHDIKVHEYVEQWMGFEIPEEQLVFVDGFMPPMLVVLTAGPPLCVAVGRGWTTENVEA